MRKLTIGPASLVAAVTIASLALVPLASARTDRQASATATTVTVRGGEFFFKLSTKSIASPRKVTFVFKNVGHVAHDFKINGKKTPVIGPVKTSRLIVTFKKKGKYTYLCTVDSHASLGMKGTFTVR
jgi:plastocyanin